MAEKTDLVYEFGRFRLHAAQRILLNSGEPVALTPKGLDTLLLLVQSGGRILEKDELMKTLWPGSFVEEGNLSQNIFILRKLLGDDHNGDSLIQTIPRRGYRFVASVKEIDATTLGNSVPGTARSSVEDYWITPIPFSPLHLSQPDHASLFFLSHHRTP